MRKKTLLPMVLVLATAGCACIVAAPPVVKGQHQPAKERLASFCPAQKCVVRVTVDEQCKVRVDPYYLVLAGEGGMEIEWRIDGQGTFAPNPIRWKQAAAQSVFESSGKDPRTEITFKNKRTIGLFNYAVAVRRDGRTCPELDPTVINDWP